MRVGDEVAGVAGQKLVDGGAVVALRVPVKSTCLSGATVTQKWPVRQRSLASTRTPVASAHSTGCVHGLREHRIDHRPHQLGQLLVPPAQRRLRDLQPVAGVDPFEPIERLVVLPAPHDRVGEHPGTRDAALDRQLERSGTKTSVASPRLRSLRTYFLYKISSTTVAAGRRSRTSRRPCRSARRRQARARPREGRFRSLRAAGSPAAACARACARVLGDGLLDGRRRSGSVRWRAAEREAEHHQRELRVVRGQALRLLTEQPALEPLILLAQVQHELPVLVALLRQGRKLRFERSGRSLD